VPSAQGVPENSQYSPGGQLLAWAPPQVRERGRQAAWTVLLAEVEELEAWYAHAVSAGQAIGSILQLPPEQQGVPHSSAQLTLRPTKMELGSP